MSRAKRFTEDGSGACEPFTDRDFADDEHSSGSSRHARSRKQAAWQRLEQREDVRRLREELEDWEDWDRLDSL